MSEDIIADLRRRVDEAEERANQAEAFACELRDQIFEIDRLTISDAAYDEWRVKAAPLLGLRFDADVRRFEPV